LALRFALYVAALALSFALTQRANADDCLGGGTEVPIADARTPGGPDGAGGTGLQGGGDDDGVGGTGAAPSDGVGGTGLFGTITGFGSICVNGQHVDYDAATRIEVDGRPASATELAVGQVARADAKRNRNGRLYARSIAVDHALVGPVDAIDPAQNQIEVMGQRVALAPQARGDLRILRKGDSVAVSGMRNASGELVATRVSPASRGEPSRAVGDWRPSARGDGSVGGVPVALPRDRAIAISQRVRVEGRWNAEARRLAIDDAKRAPAIGDGVGHAIVEGYAERAASGELRVNGESIDASAAIARSGSPQAGERVRVHAERDARGRLRAERIDRLSDRELLPSRERAIPERGRGGLRPGGERGDDDAREEDGDSSGRGSGESAEAGDDERERLDNRGSSEDRERDAERERSDRERSERDERGDRSDRSDRSDRGDRSGGHDD
jgi:hypothetical protein